MVEEVRSLQFSMSHLPFYPFPLALLAAKKIFVLCSGVLCFKNQLCCVRTLEKVASYLYYFSAFYLQ